MIRELVLHANSKGVEIALLENKKLVEFHLDSYESEGCLAGNFYLGRIKKLNPALNAAFVDIGVDKEAFIHYSDLTPSLNNIRNFVTVLRNNNDTTTLDEFCSQSATDKDGKIEDVLQKGELLLFQVAKEAISTKGPRLTCEFSLPGRYVVLTPFSNGIGISKKIESEDERNRLTSICKKYKPNYFGIIIRTNAENIANEELQQDILHLTEKWQNIIQELYLKEQPVCLYRELSKSFSLIRDLLNHSFERIVTDNEALEVELKQYLNTYIPDKARILHLHQSTTPIFEEYDVSRQVKTTFNKIVTLKSGAYLIIEHTEAMHVIDVNSGPKVKKDIDQDTNAFNINLDAVHEIARQLRLRNIGGIIVIDFIDMKLQAYKTKIFEAMQQAMKEDKAKHVILPVSKFGIMELTRQRVKEQTQIEHNTTNERKVKYDEPLQVIEVINAELESLKKHQEVSFLLYVHPFIYAYLKKGTLSFRMKWFGKINKLIKLIQDSSLKINDYKLTDSNGKSIY